MGKRWAYTDDEIIRLFRNGGETRQQITVIAQLNLKTIPDVVDKLESLGFDLSCAKESHRRYVTRVADCGKEWTHSEEIKLLDIRRRTKKTWEEIGQMLGRSGASCGAKFQRLTRGTV